MFVLFQPDDDPQIEDGFHFQGVFLMEPPQSDPAGV